MKILCICRANVGRSQILAGMLQKRFPQHTILSAGTKVVSSETGQSQHGTYIRDVRGARKVIEVLKEEGIDWEEAMRTQLSPIMLRDVDRVIVMAEPEHIPEYLKQHSNFIYWHIPDLKDRSLEFHREIKEKMKKLIEDNIRLFE